MSTLKQICPKDLYTQWRRQAIKDTLFMLFSLLASFFVCWFTKKDWNLPSYLKYFQTPDSYMDGSGIDGLNNGNGGDIGFYNKWNILYTKYNNNTITEYLSRVLISFMWQWRNTGQGYSYYNCGFTLKEGYTIFVHPDSTRDYYDDGTNTSKKEGWWYIEAINLDGTKCFQYYNLQYYSLLGNKYGNRHNKGWKISFQRKDEESRVVPIVNSIIPFKKIK